MKASNSIGRVHLVALSSPNTRVAALVAAALAALGLFGDIWAAWGLIRVYKTLYAAL